MLPRMGELIKRLAWSGSGHAGVQGGGAVFRQGARGHGNDGAE